MANETYIKHEWSNRLENGGYELSAIDGEPFDDRNARFAEGTTLAGADISRKSVREVFNILKGNDSDYRDPSKGSYLDIAIPEGEDIKNHIYEQGYLAVWTLWCRSNMPIFKELYKNSAGRTLTCYKTTSPYNPARAIADMFSGNFVEIDTERLKSVIEKNMPKMNMDVVDAFPIRTAGMGEKRLEEFWNNVPKDTNVVIDTRKQRTNRFRPQFNEPAISNLARDSNIDYLHVTDTDQLESMLVELASQGKKVTVLTSKDWIYADPGISSVCQHIEQTTDYRVLHIRQEDNTLSPITQESLVNQLLRPMLITGGDYLGIDIDREGNLTPRTGIELRRHAFEQNPQERIIEGKTNYGTEVNYLPADSKKTLDAIKTAAGIANYTLVGQFNGSDAYTNTLKGAISSRITTFSLPTRPEDYDQEHIDRAVRTLTNKIYLSLSSSYERFKTRFFDIDDYKLLIDGANLARISNLPVEGSDINLSERDRRRLYNTGTKLDDISGISQDNVNAYIEGIVNGLKDNITFKVAEGDVTTEYPGDDRYFVVTRKHYDKEKSEWYDVTETHCRVKVSTILSLGDTGIGEAAIIAAQKVNLTPVAVHTNDFKVTLDNETLTGFRISDEATYKNRFSQGLRDSVTLGQLQQQVEAVEEQRQHNIGLSDLQVLALYELGMDNTSMVQVIEYARNENISITTPSELESFISQCHMSGLCTDTYEEKVLTFSLTEAARKIEEWKKEGITFISAANILYPEGLRHQDSEYVEDYVPQTVIDRDGKESIVYVRSMVPAKYPAVLFVKGNIALLNEPSVTMLTNYNVNESDSATLKRFSRMASDRQYSIVTPLMDNGTSILVEDAINSNGIIIGVCADGFKDQSDSPEARLAKIQQHLTALGERIVHQNVDETIIDEYNRLMHEKTYLEGPAGKRQQSQYDREKGIIDNGGLLVSDKAPKEKGDKKNNSLFISKVAAGIGTVCAFIDAMSHAQPMNPVAMAAYSVYGLFKLTAAGMEAIRYKETPEEKTEKKESKAQGKDKKKKTTMSKQQTEALKLLDGDYTTKMLPEVKQTEDIFDYAKMTNDGIKLLAAGTDKKKTMRPIFKTVKAAVASAVTTAVEQSMDTSWKLTQCPIVIIRSTAHGTEPYFVVPSGQPHVESALKSKYGEDINIIRENEKGRVIDAINFGEVKVNDRMIPRYLGYKGTQRQYPEAYTETVYFHRGKIYGMAETPKLSFGIDANVEYNMKLWNDLVRMAKYEQYNFQRLSGMDAPELNPADMDNIEYPQYHYEKADHLVITPTRIEVRRGDEVRGVMSLRPDGTIYVENKDIASDDYQEYHQTKTYDVFSRTGTIHSDADVSQVIKNLNDTLISTTRDMTAYDESEKEEYEERKSTGWVVERMDNISIAQADWADGIRDGLIHDNKVPYDNMQMMNSVHCNINGKQAHIEALKGEYKDYERQYATMEKQIELAREKMSQGATGKEYATLNSLITKTSEEMLQLEQAMNGVTLQMESDYLDIATLSDIESDIRNSYPMEVVTDENNETIIIYNGENIKINSIAPIIEDALNRSSDIWTCPPYHIEDIEYINGTIKSCTIINGDGEKLENVNVVDDTVTIKGDHENIVFNILSGEQKKVELSKGKTM